MTLDTYFQKLHDYADSYAIQFLRDGRLSVEKFWEMEVGNNIESRDFLLFTKDNIVSDSDLNDKKGFLSIGYFRQFNDERERLTCFYIAHEISSMKVIAALKRIFALYDNTQPLFTVLPMLSDYVYNNELIDAKKIQQIGKGEVVKVFNKHSKIDSYLNPLILDWTLNNFEGADVYVRLNPFEVYDKPPGICLNEDVLIPPDPYWMNHLKIFNRASKGAAYYLRDCSPAEDLIKYWEYKVKLIRRLEFTANRDKSGYLSMMIEEITDTNSNNFMIGKCIHLDTYAGYGTNFKDAMLKHIDLAINIYEGDRARARLADDLTKGKVVDATFRTHLLRVEDIPLSSLIEYSRSFFTSKVLTEEWIQDQFSEIPVE